MSAYNEKPICLGNIPTVNPVYCPSALIPPQPEDLPLTITMGTTTYNGKLRVDLPDRINRVSALILELWRRVNFINFSFSTSFAHTFKYPTAEPRVPVKPDKTVTGSAFDFQQKMLVELDAKLDSIVQDLGDIRPVASIVESWQIRPEANRPQAAFLFGSWVPGSELIASPKYEIAVPFFNPATMNSYDNSFGFVHGSYQFLYTLSDNSKIIFYGNDPVEMQTVLDRWLANIDAGKKAGGFLKAGPIKGLPFEVMHLRLVRIDYYAAGIMRSTPTSYMKFGRRPIELGPPP